MALSSTWVRATLAGILLLLAVPLPAQITSGGPISSSRPTLHGRSETDFGPAGDITHDPRRMNKLNEMRQKSMTADAAKLLRLAQELNAALSKSGPALSPDERLHRIAEIEKLAKQVKTKMSYANAPVPDNLPDVTSQWP